MIPFSSLALVAVFLSALFVASPCSGTGDGGAPVQATSITADRLDYSAETGRYVAEGSVTVTRGDAVLHADRMTYDEKTTDAVAEGNVRYEDAEASIEASRAELRMDRKTGRLFDALVFFRKSNTHIKGREIEKRGDQEYYSPDASFTTCDAPLPAWCFRGKEVHASVNDRFTAREVTMRIKGLPVLYTPYLWTSLSADRQTGLLLPVPGYSRINGFEFKQPFYWAISDNRDMTLLLDYYSKRGIGTGLEYRFLERSGRHGELWLYRIRDTKRDQDYNEANALYEARGADGNGGYLSLNYVSKADYYREFSLHRDIRTQRFLESTAEVLRPLGPGRAYLLSQYWVDLKDPTGDVPQRLPEIGYVLDYMPLAGVMAGGAAGVSNIWRENGLSARRVDLFPRITHSAGGDVTVSQTVGARATAYSYYRNAGMDESEWRSGLLYDLQLHTRLSRAYGGFTHFIEPSLRYLFMDSSRNDLPVFDSAELFTRTSVIELGLVNRGMRAGREVFISRITQAFDTRGGSRPFLPLRLEAALRAPLFLLLDASYDHYGRDLGSLTSYVGFRALGADFAVGQRYNRRDDIMMYSANALFSAGKGILMAGQVWYDAKGGGLRDLTLNLKYQKQCWGVKVEAVKRPGDFTMRLLVELKGLKTELPKAGGPADSRTYF